MTQQVQMIDVNRDKYLYTLFIELPKYTYKNFTNYSNLNHTINFHNYFVCIYLVTK